MGSSHHITKLFYLTCLQQQTEVRLTYYDGIIVIIFMHTDYPMASSASGQPPAVETRVDMHSQPLTFSKDMSSEQLALWLRNHPSLSGTEYEEDISKLRSICLTLC